MNRTVLIAAATVAAVFGLSMAAISQAPSESAATAYAEASQETARFAIENMTCAACPISVRNAMKRVDGVKSVEVDFERKIATVVYDSATTTAAEIAAASTDVGYPATEIET